MENDTKIVLRNSAAVFLIILTALAIFFGAYRPFKKARLYIDVFRNVSSLGEAKDRFDKVLAYYSPVGQEEVVKFFINSVLGVISNPDMPEEAGKIMGAYIESKIDTENVIHLLHSAYLYNALWDRFGDEEYFNKAEKYYKKVLEIGPRLPHALENLFTLYKKTGRVKEAQEIANRLLELWPNHPMVLGINAEK